MSAQAPTLSDLLIGTPFDGGKEADPVPFGFMHAREQLILNGGRHLPTTYLNEDIVRARSRLVSQALRSPHPWRYLFWWDADVIPHDPLLVTRMHQVAHFHDLDVLGAPYPRKRIPVEIPYEPLPGAERLDFTDSYAEVAVVAIGFCLMSRRMLERISEAYRDELWATDEHDTDHDMVCFFMPMMTGEWNSTNGRRRRQIMSEDYSCLSRWRKIGGKVHMYLENDMRLGHAGRIVYRGDPHALRLASPNEMRAVLA